MATYSTVLTWRIPGTKEPGGLPSMGSHRVGYAAAAAATVLFLDLFLKCYTKCMYFDRYDHFAVRVLCSKNGVACDRIQNLVSFISSCFLALKTLFISYVIRVVGASFRFLCD